ncbi:MAG: membrane protein insertase YidC [Deltaproteobacteria bacterium]|nr:membrane protein insertase YidC [Deltaproteobacteria bacterium]
MDEQRRVMLAIVLTLGIFFGWQALVKIIHPPPPAKPDSVAATNSHIVSNATGPSANAVENSASSVKADAITKAPANVEVASVAPTLAKETVAPFSTEFFSGEIGDRGGLNKLLLHKYHEVRSKGAEVEPVSLVTAEIDGAQRQAQVTIKIGDKAIPLSFIERGPEKFVLSGTFQAVQATLTIIVQPDQYGISYDLQIENKGESQVYVGSEIVMGLAPNAMAETPSMFVPAADMISGLCYNEESVQRYNTQDLEDENPSFNNSAWAGLDRQYFVVAVIPQGSAGKCRVNIDKANLLVNYDLGGVNLAPTKNWNRQFVLYLGPKREADLKAVNPALSQVIDYNIWGIPLGFLARPMVLVLNVFYGLTGSWGIAIILLTFLVKALLFPVTYKSVVSMRRMSLIRPEIEKLKERYGKDRERMQLEQVKLFREKGINPLGGCLPMLLQMPVWFALYRTLWTAVDLYQQKFLWLDNLTAKESFPFLSIAFGLLTVLQQKLTPTTIDSKQAKMMMYVMPVVFAFFMIGLPSGLVLYIVVNSILTIIQQLVINRRKVTL